MNKNFVLLLALMALSIVSCSANGVQDVDSKTFSELIKSGDGIILDVRTSQEYSRGHIASSTLISINDPKAVDKLMLLQKDKPIYVYCLTGSRSRAVANYLSKNGYTKIYNLSRGFMGWQQAGYNVVKSAAPVPSSSKSYSTSEFEKLIRAEDLVLVDFHAPWCAPCKKMAPVLDQIKSTFSGKAGVAKIDIESNKSLQSAYQVQSIPGLVLFKEGKEVWRHTGAMSYEELSKIIKQYL